MLTKTIEGAPHDQSPDSTWTYVAVEADRLLVFPSEQTRVWSVADPDDRVYDYGTVAYASLEVDDKTAPEFAALARNWRAERGVLSSARQMAQHRDYIRIIDMGERAVPLILNELCHNPDHWFVALHAITGANPVPEEARGRLREMAAAWVAWGEEHSYI